MDGGLVDAILRGWHDPRGEMARQVGAGHGEARALVHLMLACGLYFVASLPSALRKAAALGNPVEGTIAAHVFGYLALAPLLGYALAAAVHLAARACGGRGGFLGARAALFWSLLMLAPLTIAIALVGVAAEVATGRVPDGLAWLDYIALGFWLWLFAASLAEAEGFGATAPVAAVVAAAFAGVAGLVGLLAAGGA